jgi:hypothetical protein
VVEETLSRSADANASSDTLDGVLAADGRARALAGDIARAVLN